MKITTSTCCATLLMALALAACDKAEEATTAPAASEEAKGPLVSLPDSKHSCQPMGSKQVRDYLPDTDITGMQIIEKLGAALEAPCAPPHQRPFAKHYSLSKNVMVTLFDGKCESSTDPRYAAMEYQQQAPGFPLTKGCWTLVGTDLQAVINYRAGSAQGSEPAHEFNILKLGSDQAL